MCLLFQNIYICNMYISSFTFANSHNLKGPDLFLCQAVIVQLKIIYLRQSSKILVYNNIQ